MECVVLFQRFSSLKFIGELGDVLDVRFFYGDEQESTPSHVIVASNDERVKIFHLKTWDCQMLKGHTDIVIGLDVSYDQSLIATCSKVSSSLAVQRNSKEHRLHSG